MCNGILSIFIIYKLKTFQNRVFTQTWTYDCTATNLFKAWPLGCRLMGSGAGGHLMPQLCRVDLTCPAICNMENKLPTHVCEVNRWRTWVALALQGNTGLVSSVLEQSFRRIVGCSNTFSRNTLNSSRATSIHPLPGYIQTGDARQGATRLAWHPVAALGISLSRGRGDISLCP